ncbi:MAG: hypothetical protein WCD37_08560 [Chloroflexia bacterium]
MGDKNPKNIDKLREQAEGNKEEATEFRQETPARKARHNEREDAIQETKIDREYGEEPEPTEG